MNKEDLELFKKFNNKLIRETLSKDYYSNQTEETIEYNINSLVNRLKEILGDKYA